VATNTTQTAKRQAVGSASTYLGSGVTTQQLLCGQTMLCGVVTITVTTGFVTVSVQGANGWTISSTAIFVGQVANGGFPGAVPGQYPIMATVGASNSFTTGPIAAPCAAGDAGKSYVVAVSVHTDSHGPGGGQTGWANGPIPFPLAKWGWYSNACVPCTSDAAALPPPTTTHAGGDDGATDADDKVKSKVAMFSMAAGASNARNSHAVRVTVTSGTSSKAAAMTIQSHLDDDGVEATVEDNDDGSLTVKLDENSSSSLDDIAMSIAQLQEVSGVSPITDSATATNDAISIAVSTVLLIASVAIVL